MTSQIIYKGALRTEATHLQSNTVIETDAPTDNQGKGERFSPTDLLATSLGNCMMTIMGIKARDMNIDLAIQRLTLPRS
jgi:putative redox protein